jgi:hypothetical protein
MLQSANAPQFGAASTRLAPAAPALAYSMTGNMEALTDYVQEYQSGPNDYHVTQRAQDIAPFAPDSDLDASYEQAPDRPVKKSFLLVGSLAAGFVGIGIAILTTAVVVTVTPTADQKPITSTQQPVLEPLATRVSEAPVAIPASAPVEPAPAPPAPPPPPAPRVIAPPPKAPVTPRQAPHTTQTQTHTTQTQTHTTQAPQDTTETTTPPPDRDVPPAHEGNMPPHRSDPLPDNGDGPPPRGHSPFSPNPADPLGLGGGEPRQSGGLFGGAGCIPLLPC